MNAAERERESDDDAADSDAKLVSACNTKTVSSIDWHGSQTMRPRRTVALSVRGGV